MKPQPPPPSPTHLCSPLTFPPLRICCAHPVGGSEYSLTARLRQGPANAWLAAPDSARLGAQEPGVSLSNCDAGSN